VRQFERPRTEFTFREAKFDNNGMSQSFVVVDVDSSFELPSLVPAPPHAFFVVSVLVYRVNWVYGNPPVRSED
jgi:hypothetical protein